MEKQVQINKDSIKNKIHKIRGVQVILDEDLAELYNIAVKSLNQAVKRNIERFPNKFMFQISKNEFDILRSHFVTTNANWSKKRFLPHVFTEQGVAMASSILRSKKAIEVSIQIIEAFISMRKFISKNAEIFTRLDSVERKQIEYQINTDKNFEKIFTALEPHKPKQGIFYDGQIFDAYKFVSDLIRDANKSIILINNYIDDSVLTLFSKRKKNIEIIIYTKNISKQLKLDLEKFNSQYKPIKIKEFKKSHDRFLIIDNKEVYHFGASLKDLGKKWFGFSKFNVNALEILKMVKK